MEPFKYADPVQPGGTPDQIGGDGKVHRQRGLDPTQQELARDPTPPQAVIQGSTEIHTTRNVGLGQHFLSDGTLIADHRSEDSTFFADLPTVAIDEQMPPPAPAPLAASDLPLPPPARFDVTPSDEPGAAGADPRDASTGPQIMSKDQVPVIKKVAIVPVVISASGAVIVRAERIAATMAAAKKKGKK